MMYKGQGPKDGVHHCSPKQARESERMRRIYGRATRKPDAREQSSVPPVGGTYGGRFV